MLLPKKIKLRATDILSLVYPTTETVILANLIPETAFLELCSLQLAYYIFFGAERAAVRPHCS